MVKNVPVPLVVVLAVAVFAAGYFVRPLFEESDERICAQIFGDGRVGEDDARLLKKLGLKSTDKTGAMMFCQMKLKL